ncbi:MAG TPA: polymer-forming cytoskeletal protein [Dongiaceae bacterium]|jgi:cytoskeletal protein CcmA (bactofilin family)|nr:polymer-forming cytoskeletal protein [Dongiaceae bacterium]
MSEKSEGAPAEAKSYVRGDSSRAKYEAARRGAEMLSPLTNQKASEEAKKLVVGRDIVLNGEIHACNHLIIEGRVEASLKGCAIITLAPGGEFKGTADVDTADVNGRFEGELIVRKRLVLRAKGQITGKVRYQELEVEKGGIILGQVEPLAPEVGR